MASFPKLKTGAVLQYPATRELRSASEVLRFVDGTSQSFRASVAVRRWEIRLDELDESEMAAIEEFCDEMSGESGSFSFTDPWDGAEYSDCSLESGQLEMQATGEMRNATSLTIRENLGPC